VVFEHDSLAQRRGWLISLSAFAFALCALVWALWRVRREPA
jgi:hypothetical protein